MQRHPSPSFVCFVACAFCPAFAAAVSLLGVCKEVWGRLAGVPSCQGMHGQKIIIKLITCLVSGAEYIAGRIRRSASAPGDQETLPPSTAAAVRMAPEWRRWDLLRSLARRPWNLSSQAVWSLGADCALRLVVGASPAPVGRMSCCWRGKGGDDDDPVPAESDRNKVRAAGYRHLRLLPKHCRLHQGSCRTAATSVSRALHLCHAPLATASRQRSCGSSSLG